MSPRRDIPEETRQLGRSLRELRTNAGVTGQQLADRTGLSQSTISRAELGQTVLAMPDLDAWFDATKATADARDTIIRQFEAAAVRVISWRQAERRGLAELQHDVKAAEASAATILNFQPVNVPGLLQTADYTRRMILSRYPNRADLAKAIQARIDRQAILHDDSKHLEFIMTEAVLRGRMGPSSTMRGQIDRIMNIATLPSVTIGIVPSSAEITAWHLNGFQIIDDVSQGAPMVRTETLTQGVLVTDPADVEQYREAYRAVRATATFGQEANQVLAAMMGEYS